MTRFQSSIAGAGRSAALALLLLGAGFTISACSTDRYADGYLANAVNPHPELMGGTIVASDVKSFANVTNPFPRTSADATAVAEQNRVK